MHNINADKTTILWFYLANAVAIWQFTVFLEASFYKVVLNQL